MARLLIKTSDSSARQLILGPACVLGRASSVDCKLPSPSVSRRHALIERRPGGFFLVDLGSRNGTYLNGRPIDSEGRLRDRDLIRVGDEHLQFFEDGVESRNSVETEPLPVSGSGRSSGGNGPTRTPPATRPLDPARRQARRRKIGKFLLKKVLGRGGMGTVYLAHDVEADRDVAVKFIMSRIGRNESFLDFFHNREAVLARQIDHPNVIRVFEHGVHGDEHYISMEYIPGVSLYQALKKKRPSIAETVEILRQIACGLYAAHGQGVVHSDIKPANILIDLSILSNGENGGDIAQPEDDSILDFDTREVPVVSPLPEPVDDELAREIQRRVGIPAAEVLLEPPHYERASEMRFLEHYRDRLAEGRGCFLVVAGDRGVGKTRLVSEFVARETGAGPSGALEAKRVLTLDCSVDDGVAQLYRRLAPDSQRELDTAEMVDVLAGKIAEESVPTIVRIEGLECADPLEGRLIKTWTERASEQPLLLVAEVDSGETDRNAELRRLLEAVKPSTKELFLRPLTEYQIQRYLTQTFRRAPPPDLAGDLFRLTRGNFTRLREVFQGFLERGLLKTDPATGALVYRANFREFELEEGKQLWEVFRSYGKLEQHILENAAFIGYRFFFDTLLRFQSLDETSLFFMLRNLASDGFIVEEDRTWYRFTNAAFQRYLAERIPPHERPQLHRKIALLLHSAPVPPSPELCQLKAHHCLACKETSRAVEFLLEGAYRARVAYKDDMVQEMYHDVLRIYRSLAARESLRREVLQVLRSWFGRDGNWYAILGRLAAEENLPWVKIADFGISFRVDAERGLRIESGVVMGTPRYMSPERSGTNRGGPASDIFSLGVLAFELLVGEPPFPELKGWKIRKAYRKRPIRLPGERISEMPAALVELVHGMLDQDPQRRPRIEDALKSLTRLQLELAFQRGEEA